MGGRIAHRLHSLEATVVMVCLFCSWHLVAGVSPLLNLTSCLQEGGIQNFTTPQSNSAAYNSMLDFSLQNLRFTEAGVLKPDVLIFPESAAQVQKALTCSLSSERVLRVRSGGHSYEGLSSTANAPFVIIDLMNMHAVNVDVGFKTAWIEAGATLGELYYGISQVTSEYGFPAGVCPTVGSGGHFSGGGYGFLSRKYGSAADNVIDAQLVNANGDLLDRSSMGEDLFWALRGGGGGSWGIVVAWKINLVQVTPTVTTFSVWKTGKELLTDLIYQWQIVIPSSPEELFHAVYMAGITTTVNSSTSVKDLGASFYGQYLGTIDETVALMTQIYPELGLTAADCKQGSWVEAVANIASVASPSAMAERLNSNKNYFKAKSDYVKAPISKQGLEGALSLLEEDTRGYMIFEPYGGVMDKISTDAIAFPHRAGNLYNIQYQAVWSNDTGSPDDKLIAWLRNLYSYMATYVSQAPRAAYVNYLDLDLGTTGPNGNGSAESWGERYFLQNFRRLAQIKSKVDPGNVFSNPQTIPPSR